MSFTFLEKYKVFMKWKQVEQNWNPKELEEFSLIKGNPQVLEHKYKIYNLKDKHFFIFSIRPATQRIKIRTKRQIDFKSSDPEIQNDTRTLSSTSKISQEGNLSSFAKQSSTAPGLGGLWPANTHTHTLHQLFQLLVQTRPPASQAAGEINDGRRRRVGEVLGGRGLQFRKHSGGPGWEAEKGRVLPSPKATPGLIHLDQIARHAITLLRRTAPSVSISTPSVVGKVHDTHTLTQKPSPHYAKRSAIGNNIHNNMY